VIGLLFAFNELEGLRRGVLSRQIAVMIACTRAATSLWPPSTLARDRYVELFDSTNGSSSDASVFKHGASSCGETVAIPYGRVVRSRSGRRLQEASNRRSVFGTSRQHSIAIYRDANGNLGATSGHLRMTSAADIIPGIISH